MEEYFESDGKDGENVGSEKHVLHAGDIIDSRNLNRLRSSAVLDNFLAADSRDFDESEAPYFRWVERKICCSRDGCFKGWKIVAYTAFGVAFVAFASIVDGFDVQEFVEFLTRQEFEGLVSQNNSTMHNSNGVEGFTLMSTGIGVSALTHLPIILTILFNRNRPHAHEHSIGEKIRDFITIGLPHSMLASAAIIEFMEKFWPNLSLPLKTISIPPALFLGMCQAELDGIFIHEAEHQVAENRPGAFCRAAYRTVFQGGWRNFFVVSAILAAHVGGGIFGAHAFVDKWGINDFSKTLGFVITILTICGIIMHALGESFALNQAFNGNNTNYMKIVYAILFINAIFHVIPEFTGIAGLLLSALNLFFGLDDWVAASLCMALTVAALGYPNVRGYVAATIPTFNDLFESMLNRVGGVLRGGREAEDYADVELRRIGGNNLQRFFSRAPVDDAEEDRPRCTIL